MSISRRTTTITPPSIDQIKAFEKDLAEYRKLTDGMSPLRKHIFYFSTRDGRFSPASIAKKIKGMNNSCLSAYLKGTAIFLFNAGHGGSCVISKDTSLASFLHVGTARFWNEDESVNQENINRLIEEREIKEVVPRSKLHLHLAVCLERDPDIAHTGRQVRRLNFCSKMTQSFAGSAAWDEYFNTLSCGRVSKAGGKPGETEPCIAVDVLREVFEDTGYVFLRAKHGLIPGVKAVQQSAESESKTTLKRAGAVLLGATVATLFAPPAAVVAVASAALVGVAVNGLSESCSKRSAS